MKKFLEKIFGGVTLSWKRVVLLAVVFGVYTAIVAMLVPDGNSFHDIAVTPEAWVLPAIFIIVNSKKPLEAALKVFVFFLISQPLVYLIQVPFSSLGWGLFGYYKYWFIITLFTFPAGFVGWFIKKDKFYSGLILATMTGLLAVIGVGYVSGFVDSFPNHLISAIYCFGMIPILILFTLKSKVPRIICAVVTAVVLGVFVLVANKGAEFETYNNMYLEENNITFVGEPYISMWSGNGKGGVELVNPGAKNYTLRLSGMVKGGVYYFAISDEENEYTFEYYYDEELKTVVLKRQ